MRCFNIRSLRVSVTGGAFHLLSTAARKAMLFATLWASVLMISSESQAQSWGIALRWTAPGDDDNTGRAAAYDVRYSTDSIDESNWDLAVQVAGEPLPSTAGASDSFLVTGLQPLTTYYLAVKTRDEANNWSPVSNVVRKTTSFSTGIDEDDLLPKVFELLPNYPNPFNPGTTIACNMASAGHLRIEVFNILGRFVTDVVDQYVPAGTHTFTWNGVDSRGVPVASGVYFYRMEAGSFQQSRRMTLLR